MTIATKSYQRLTALLLIGSFLLPSAAAHVQGKVSWLQEHFPHPETEAAKCRSSTSHRLCDPDGFLSESGLQKVEDYLQHNKLYIQASEDCLVRAVQERTNQEEEKDNEPPAMELQMGVAIVQGMDLTPFPQTEDRVDQAAETFARYVHDQWGVGVETESCGGAGILLFFSIDNRAMYISRGAALEGTLTDRRLDQVMDNMKEYLRAEDYDQAILQALQDIQHYVQQGPPTQWETLFHQFLQFLFPAIWITTLLGTLLRNAWTNSRMQREYARVQSQLNEIDRARAEALQGKYNCTSCPICLEDFAKPEEGGVVTTGSDGQPIKLLRCGHCMDETCWAEWVSSGRGTITKCPICMQDIGSSNSASTPQEQPQDQQQARRRDANNNNNDNLANLHNQEEDEWNNREEDRIMRQYRRERNFRLARLGARYPRIVRPAQIQRWSNPTYDGQLVRDPGFVQSNPSLARPYSGGGGRSMRSGGFGGSSSAGGRGGSW